MKVMPNTQIAQFLSFYIGIAYIAVGLGVLINIEYYKKLLEEDYIENRPVVYLNGFIILAIGCLLIKFHNIWVKDWPIILTLFGWFAFIKGLFILVLPRAYLQLSRSLKKKKTHLIAEAILVVAVGIFLVYFSYFVLPNSF